MTSSYIHHSQFLTFADDTKCFLHIKAMILVFSRHGIPNTITADNIPFDSAEFKQFAKKWDLQLQHQVQITHSQMA